MPSRALAPIAVFAFKRPDHLALALASLGKCRLAAESVVFIYCDGARSESELAAVESTRAVARAQVCFRELHVVERSENWGLSKSITTGVSELCEKFGKVIVLEDDLRVSPHFLEFMNEALDRYEAEARVLQISGYMYPVVAEVTHDAFFAVQSSCWGWATWGRAWKEFGPHDEEVKRLQIDLEYRYRFDLNGSYPYFRMLLKQLAGEINSWGILWYLSIFSKRYLVLMPRETLVANIGNDGSGSHAPAAFNDELGNFVVKDFPPVEEDDAGTLAINSYLRTTCVPWYRRFARWAFYL